MWQSSPTILAVSKPLEHELASARQDPDNLNLILKSTLSTRDLKHSEQICKKVCLAKIKHAYLKQSLSFRIEHADHPHTIESDEICSLERSDSRKDATSVANDRGELFQGWLQKRGQGPFSSWRSRWFELKEPGKFVLRKGTSKVTTYCALLAYKSDTKGERLLFVQDVRRESKLDSDQEIAFSVGVVEPTAGSGAADSPAAMLPRRRVYLKAPSEFEAVVVLTCLRRILEPSRELPSLSSAVHHPLDALKMLE